MIVAWSPETKFLDKLPWCPDCESSHIGENPCGMTYMERLRSTQLSPSVTPTKSLRKYWDTEALTDQFGDHATDYSLDLTNGEGLNDAPREKTRTFI